MFVIHHSDRVPGASAVQTVASDVGTVLLAAQIGWSLSLRIEVSTATPAPTSATTASWLAVGVGLSRIVPVTSADPGASFGAMGVDVFVGTVPEDTLHDLEIPEVEVAVEVVDELDDGVDSPAMRT